MAAPVPSLFSPFSPWPFPSFLFSPPFASTPLPPYFSSLLCGPPLTSSLPLPLTSSTPLHVGVAAVETCVSGSFFKGYPLVSQMAASKACRSFDDVKDLFDGRFYRHADDDKLTVSPPPISPPRPRSSPPSPPRDCRFLLSPLLPLSLSGPKSLLFPHEQTSVTVSVDRKTKRLQVTGYQSKADPLSPLPLPALFLPLSPFLLPPIEVTVCDHRPQAQLAAVPLP